MVWRGPLTTLGPGQSVRFGYTWGNYNGLQVASVEPLTLYIIPRNTELIVSDPGVSIVAPGSGVANYVYEVTVTNAGQFVALFQLIGGAIV